MDNFVQVGTVSIAILQLAHDVTASHNPTPRTGHQYAKVGGEKLDKTIEILNGPLGDNMDDGIREQYLVRSHGLVPLRQNLEEETSTYLGSALSWGAAKKFYTQADKLHGQTRASSHQANIDKSLQGIKKRRQSAQQDVCVQEESELQARFQIEEGTSLRTPSYPQYPSVQEPAIYPATAYHSNNLLRC